MSFYAHSRAAIVEVVKARFANPEASKEDLRLYPWRLPSHVLWMAKEMETWDTSSLKRATKAGRWIGWMFRATEELRLWSNDDSRMYVKKDGDVGYDLPH